MKLAAIADTFSQYQYNCPSSVMGKICGWPVWFNEEQLKDQKLFHVCQNCGNRFGLTRPDHLKKTADTVFTGIKAELLDLLCGADIPMIDAKRRVNAVFAPGLSLDQLVSKAFQI